MVVVMLLVRVVYVAWLHGENTAQKTTSLNPGVMTCAAWECGGGI